MRKPLSLLVVLATLVATTVAAQELPDLEEFSISRFSPAPGPGNYFSVEGIARLPAHLNPAFGLTLDYANRPFTLTAVECDSVDQSSCEVVGTESDLVSYTATAHLMAALGLIDRLQVGLVLPIGLAGGEGFSYTPSGGAEPVVLNGGDGNEWSQLVLGDPRLSVKARLFGTEQLAFGVSVFGTIPLGQLGSDTEGLSFTGRFQGEDGPSFGGRVIGEFSHDAISVAANLGGAYRPSAKLFSTSVGSQITYGLGGRYTITPLFSVMGELEGSSSFTSEVDENPLEGRLGAALRIGDLSVTLGGGAGLVRGAGTPVFRVVAGVQWAPERMDQDGDEIIDTDDACPDEPEDNDDFEQEDGCPEEDNDHDGMADAQDRCPDEAEDADGQNDDDGCPDQDNDNDGVADGYDSCPAEPEDRDGDRDDDGCPENDRDRDGVEDGTDRCPDEAEDTDGFGDEDGCPETDFDGDGMLDDADECPDATETTNGIADEDGCPEADQDSDLIVDAVDRCPDRAETIDGTDDNDGCPDGPALIQFEGDRVVVLGPASFNNRGQLSGAAAQRLIGALAFAIQRNARFSNATVVVTAASEEEATQRATGMADALARRGIDREALEPVGRQGEDGIALERRTR